MISLTELRLQGSFTMLRHMGGAKLTLLFVGLPRAGGTGPFGRQLK
jgi:hypothetical protein